MQATATGRVLHGRGGLVQREIETSWRFSCGLHSDADERL
jgi:hypothetical protein